jgi:hypothetical protein
MSGLESMAASDDLYLSVHNHLKEHLANYQLMDLFDALHFVPKDTQYRATLVSRDIIYKSKKLTYMVRIAVSDNNE